MINSTYSFFAKNARDGIYIQYPVQYSSLLTYHSALSPPQPHSDQFLSVVILIKSQLFIFDFLFKWQGYSKMIECTTVYISHINSRRWSNLLLLNCDFWKIRRVFSKFPEIRRIQIFTSISGVSGFKFRRSGNHILLYFDNTTLISFSDPIFSYFQM